MGEGDGEEWEREGSERAGGGLDVGFRIALGVRVHVQCEVAKVKRTNNILFDYFLLIALQIAA